MYISRDKRYKEHLPDFKVVLLMIPYWICYSHIIGNIYQLQGLHMSLGFPLRQPTIFPIKTAPPEGYTSSKTVQLQLQFWLFLTIYLFWYSLPFAHTFYKCLTARNFVIYTYRRLVTGMIIASLSILAAGAIETVRLQNIYFTYYLAAPSLNILWQTIQYCLAGASEILFTPRHSHCDCHCDCDGLCLWSLSLTISI
ncbi:hypothetical protein EB796_019434 [Bugula neritina]|uniref:Uncharacterized protein n=1 Tax=Bugula neritina TaxID=10212 RepID=A0A7J7J7N5_BUGNE|nr:hypothetical protein EB796_019434 [Bugula neritina]